MIRAQDGHAEFRRTELNQNRPHARKWVQFENACPKSGISPPPTNRGPQNHLFRRLRNLTATSKAYIFGMKHNIDNRWVRWQLHGVSYVAAECYELWSRNGLKLDLHFTHPPHIMRFSSLPGFTHALQTTELNQTLPHGRGKPRLQTAIKCFGTSTPQKFGAQKLRTYFRRLRN